MARYGPAQSVDTLAGGSEDQLAHGSQVLQFRKGRIERFVTGGGQVQPGFPRPRPLGYADFRGNGQYISTGNIEASKRASLILIDYPNQQRLKVWVEATIIEAAQDVEL